MSIATLPTMPLSEDWSAEELVLYSFESPFLDGRSAPAFVSSPGRLAVACVFYREVVRCFRRTGPAEGHASGLSNCFPVAASRMVSNCRRITRCANIRGDFRKQEY